MDRVLLPLYDPEGPPVHVGNGLVWTDGRLDRDALRERIALLAGTYPELSSRLVRRGGDRAHWALVGGTPPIREHDLSSEEDVLALVTALVARPMDLERGPPAEFHLLHAGEGDVLMLRWSHLLTNGGGFERILREFPRLGGTDTRFGPDPLRAYLREVPLGRKVRALPSYLWDRLVPSARAGAEPTDLVRYPAVIEAPAVMEGAPCSVHVALRELDVESTRAMEKRAGRVAGLGGLVPAIVASCFRAVARVRGDVEGRSLCRTMIPIALRPRSAGRVPVLTNLAPNLPVAARGSELDDREALTALIASQVRDHLRSGFDLGQVQVASWVAGPVGWWLLRRWARRVRTGIVWMQPTFTFTHRGTVAEDALSVCGVRITRAHEAMIPPAGLLVETARCGGRLQLSVTVTVEEGVDGQAAADRLADAILADLASEAGLGRVTAGGRARRGLKRVTSDA